MRSPESAPSPSTPVTAPAPATTFRKRRRVNEEGLTASSSEDPALSSGSTALQSLRHAIPRAQIGFWAPRPAAPAGGSRPRTQRRERAKDPARKNDIGEYWPERHIHPHPLAVRVRVALVGLGGVGRVLAHELSNNPRGSSLQIIDKVKITSRGLPPLRSRIEVGGCGLDAAHNADLVPAGRGCGVVGNRRVSDLNLGIMRGSLRVGADYLDVAATRPRKPRGR